MPFLCNYKPIKQSKSVIEYSTDFVTSSNFNDHGVFCQSIFWGFFWLVTSTSLPGHVLYLCMYNMICIL